MKILTLSILIALHSISFAFAQNATEEINSISITVELEDGNNIISWKSNREVNTSYYMIEKSVDGAKFELLSTQKAGSSTYQKTDYSYEDVTGNSDLAQYRITLVKMDGSTLSTLSNRLIEEKVANAIVK